MADGLKIFQTLFKDKFIIWVVRIAIPIILIVLIIFTVITITNISNGKHVKLLGLEWNEEQKKNLPPPQTTMRDKIEIDNGGTVTTGNESPGHVGRDYKPSNTTNKVYKDEKEAFIVVSPILLEIVKLHDSLFNVRINLSNKGGSNAENMEIELFVIENLNGDYQGIVTPMGSFKTNLAAGSETYISKKVVFDNGLSDSILTKLRFCMRGIYNSSNKSVSKTFRFDYLYDADLKLWQLTTENVEKYLK